MNSIDSLEFGGARGSHPFQVIHEGQRVTLPDPRAKHYQWILLALGMGHVPGTPHPIPEWKRELVFDRWRAAWGLPIHADARRLCYLVDKYRPEISHDLLVTCGLDLGDLWRDRKWTVILDVIDRLPSHSWFSATVSMDEEHAEMMAESIAARRAESGESEDRGPALTSWTPEVAALARLTDVAKGIQHAIIAVNSEKGKGPEAPKPEPRPVTPLEKAIKKVEFERKKSAHKALVARVLPRKG